MVIGRRFGGRREEPAENQPADAGDHPDSAADPMPVLAAPPPPVGPTPTSGPPLSGPPLSGPPLSGPPLSGPPLSGPAPSGPAPSGPPPTTVQPAASGSIPTWLVEDEPATGRWDPRLVDTADTDLLHPIGRPEPEHAPLDGPEPSLVRPYSRTGGRTKPGHELDLEALVGTTVNGKEAWASPLLSPEHVQVIGMCVDTTSVAEIAARLAVPIGVARVIIADMVDLGLVEVGRTSASYGDERDPAFLRRVLSGLQRL
jgi:hypothetical protein